MTPLHHATDRTSRPPRDEALEHATPIRWAPIRWDLVRRVRAELARGSYLTPARWEAAVARLLERESLAG